MPLPIPNLDDRRFQDFVDDAKRLVRQRCPEWTDHNVSDPGITIIETFAMMLDQVMYRLNRVPESHYLRFLELIGVRPFPPTAAHTELTFWLSSPAEEYLTIEVDTEVSTEGTQSLPPAVFSTTRELVIPPCELSAMMTMAAGTSTVPPGDPIDQTSSVEGYHCFSRLPQPGDTVFFGLSEAVGGCVVLLRVECEVEGVGVNPTDPPWVFEVWTGHEWCPCEIDTDTTGGFNRVGDIVLHIPRGQVESVMGRRRAAWIACRVTPPVPDQPFYSQSPIIRSVAAMTIGGTTEAVHAQLVLNEIVGTSEGVSGQRFQLSQFPVVGNAGAFTVEVSSDDEGWRRWDAVETFAYSEPTDHHFLFDPAAGEIRFGPVVRTPDGGLRHYGAVPPKGAVIRIPQYRTGGGKAGNISKGRLKVLRTSIPDVRRVENRVPANGGIDGESVAQAAVRGPLVLRTRERAVTAEDYEQLARQAAPEIARVRCVPAGDHAARVLVVPSVPVDENGRLPFAELRPTPAVLKRIAKYLDERRCLGARIVVEPPYYQGVTVIARIRAFPSADTDILTSRALSALYNYFDPLTGGPDSQGWPFGRPAQTGEVYAVLQRLPGVDLIDDVRLFGADPLTGERGGAVTRLDLSANSLIFSYQHQVKVTSS